MSQEVLILKRLFGLIFVCIMLIPHFAFALTEWFAYGGSEFDSLGWISVSDDDRIVMTGITKSSDGTLSTRTMNGQCGWVLCIDGNGQVLWNFCRHTAKMERMDAPAILPDGHITALYRTEQNGIAAIDLITLSADGKMISSKPLIHAPDNMTHVGTYGYDSEKGYIITEMDKRTGEFRVMAYNQEGQYICDTDDYSIGDPATAIMNDGTRVWIQAIEQNAGDVMVTFDRPDSPDND